MALILNEQSVNAIEELSRVSRCPICDRNDENIGMSTLLSCGHYACDVCVKQHINQTNKCLNCYETNRPNDIKPDPYITSLVQSVAKLSRMVTIANQTNDQSDQNNKRLTKPKPKSKTLPKTQKQLIIESLKACSAKKTVDKEKENTKPDATTKAKSKSNKKIKTQEVVELMDDSQRTDTNIEVIPDSYEGIERDNHSKPNKSIEEKSIQTNIMDEKAVTIEKAIQTVLNRKLSIQTQCDIDTTDASTQTVTEISKISADCHENQCCLRKNLAKILDLSLCPTLDTILSALIDGSKQTDCSVNGIDLEVMSVTSIKDSERDNDNDLKVEEKRATTRVRNLNSNKRAAIHLEDKSVKTKNSRLKESQAKVEEKPVTTRVQRKAGSSTKRVNDSESDVKLEEKRVTTRVRNLRAKSNKQANTDLEDVSIDDNIENKSIRAKNSKESDESSDDSVSNENVKNEDTARGRRVSSRRENDVTKSKNANKRQLKSKVNSVQSLSIKKEKNSELSRTSSDMSDDVFKRPHSPSPSPSRSRSASNSSINSRFRSQSNESFAPKKYYILYVGLNLKEKNKLERVAQRLGGVNTVTEWCAAVTHLVCGLADEFKKEDLVAVRNQKYLMALMANNYIVSFDWIIDSDKSGRFVDESKFEIKGVRQYPKCNAPYKSRTSRKKFFDGYKIYFRDCFNSLSEQVLHELVITGGGQVIRTEHELSEFKRMLPLFDESSSKLVIVSADVGTANTQDGVKFVAIETFIEALTLYNSV